MSQAKRRSLPRLLSFASSLRRASSSQSIEFAAPAGDPVEADLFPLVSPADDVFEVIAALRQNSLKVFTTQPAAYAAVPDVRIIVWALSPSRRAALRLLVENARSTGSSAVLAELLADAPDDYTGVVETLLSAQDAVFSPTALLPHYTPDGAMTACPVETLFDAFMRHLIRGPAYQHFVSTLSLFTSPLQLLAVASAWYDAFLARRAAAAGDDAALDREFEQLMRFLQTFTVVHATPAFAGTPEMDAFLASALGRVDHPSANALRTAFAPSHAAPAALGPARLAGVQSTRLIKNSFAAGLELIDQHLAVPPQLTTNKSAAPRIYELKPLVLAEQLVLFDHQHFAVVQSTAMLAKVPFRSYVNKLKNVELLVVSSIDRVHSKRIFSYFAKVAVLCLKRGDFNMAYLIYSVIVQQSIQKPDLFKVCRFHFLLVSFFIS